MDIDKIFSNRQKKEVPKSRDYDVKITLNKSGSKGFVIRFGFLNNAAKAFDGSQYIQVSNVEVLADRIYFRLFDEKQYLDVYKLSSSYKSRTKSLYTAITPTQEAEKIYRTRWVGKTFTLNYDDENQLHYIELGGEE